MTILADRHPIRVLVVDDNPEILSMLRRALHLHHYEVIGCADGESALAVFTRHTPDMVVLDLMLPDVDGIDLCYRMHEISQVPILMLTSRDAVHDRVEGLRAGAADYLVKPFAMEELLARIEAVLRRYPSNATRIVYKDLLLDLDAHRVTRDGREIGLTPKEFLLLTTLARRPDRVITREVLSSVLWPDADQIEENLLDVHVANLRQKLEVHDRPRLIQTVRGIGFVLR